MMQNKNNRQLPKTATRRHRRHGWIVAIFFVALVVAAVIILINVFKPIEFQNQPSAQKEEKPVEISNPPEVKGAASETEAPSEEAKSIASDGTPLRNEGEDPNLSDVLTGAITFAGSSEGKLAIRLNIDQYLTAGTCRLTLISTAGNAYTREAKIIPSVSSSTCDGFDIPVSEIEAGNYSIQVQLESAEKIGTIAGEVNL